MNTEATDPQWTPGDQARFDRYKSAYPLLKVIAAANDAHEPLWHTKIRNMAITKEDGTMMTNREKSIALEWLETCGTFIVDHMPIYQGIIVWQYEKVEGMLTNCVTLTEAGRRLIPILEMEH